MTEWPRSSPFLLRANSASRFSGSSSGVRDWRTFSRTRGRATERPAERPSNDNSVGNAACNKNCRNRCEKWLAEKDGRGRSERAKNHLGLIAVIRKGKRKGREKEGERLRELLKRPRACRGIELFVPAAAGSTQRGRGGFQERHGLSAPQRIYPQASSSSSFHSCIHPRKTPHQKGRH